MILRRTLLIIPVVILTIIFSIITPTCAYADDSNNYQPRLTAPNSSISYYSSDNAYAQTGYGMPNCVAYAYGRIYEMNQEKPKITRGDASEWYFTNKANGYYDYGNEPKLGAVACWSNHVAVVEKISDNGVTVSESHWGGTYFDTKTFTDMNSHYGQSFYGYIYTYNNGITQELENKLVNAQPPKKSFGQQQKAVAITPSEVNAFDVGKLDNIIIIKPQNTLLLNPIQ